MPELTSVFINSEACAFSRFGEEDYDDEEYDEEEYDEDDDDDDDNDNNDDDDDNDDNDDDDGEEEEDASNDETVVIKSRRQGENERIDLPKLTSFHVEDGFTFSRARSILFSGFAAILS